MDGIPIGWQGSLSTNFLKHKKDVISALIIRFATMYEAILSNPQERIIYEYRFAGRSWRW